MDIQVQNTALHALRRVLSPVARIALKAGLTFADFNEAAKRAFVAGARADYGLRGRPTNVARVALLTGLSRKECTRIKKLLEEEGDELDATVRSLSPAARVMSIWSTDPRFSIDGEPRPLPRSGTESLATLITEHVGDIPEGAVLAELERVGGLTQRPDGTVALTQRSFLPAGLNNDKLRILGNQFEDLGNTVLFNLDSVKRTKLQRYVVNDDIPAHLVDEFQEHATELAQELLERLDEWLSAREATKPDTSEPSESFVKRSKTVRTGLGVYFFDQPRPQ